MALEFVSRDAVWTYLAARLDRDLGSAPERTVSALQRLAARVTDEVERRVRLEDPPNLAFQEATKWLRGERLKRVYHRSDNYGPPVHENTFEAHIPRLEQAYGLSKAPRTNRPARALILLAAECRLAPLIEGNLAAVDWGPASTRTDLRGALHLISRWWWQNTPLILSRLAVYALTLEDEEEEHLPFRPITRLYEGVLAHHRPDGAREDEANKLSAATTRILYDAYWKRSLKREIMQRLFAEAEALRIVERRPPFDADPVVRRRNELTRLLLARELDNPTDSQTAALIGLLHEAPPS